MTVLAASGIILKDKKILLLQRSAYTKNYPLYWGCPGGRAEQNETPVENVIREVKEECNLNFTPTKIFKTGVWQDRFYYRFLGSWSGTISIQEEEVKAFKWFKYEETLQLNLSFDYKEVIELLHQKMLL